jgi:hypothetical protein
VARWLIPLAIPLAGLALLLSRPRLDVHWEHHPAHFWLVLVTALLSVVLGYLAGEAARRLEDARLFLVSLAFVTSAGFLALHALATPGVLLEKKNAGFVVTTPVGLAIASIFAAASAVDLSPTASAAVMRRQWLLRGIVFGLLGAWGVYSLSGLHPLNRALTEEEAHGPLYTLAVIGLPLYAFAAVRYVQLYRRRPAPMPAAIAAAIRTCHSHHEACQLRAKATAIIASASRIHAVVTPSRTRAGRRR